MADRRRCFRCGYSLKGLPEVLRCPECGLPYHAWTAMIEESSSDAYLGAGFAVVGLGVLVAEFTSGRANRFHRHPLRGRKPRAGRARVVEYWGSAGRRIDICRQGTTPPREDASGYGGLPNCSVHGKSWRWTATKNPPDSTRTDMMLRWTVAVSERIHRLAVGARGRGAVLLGSAVFEEESSSD